MPDTIGESAEQTVSANSSEQSNDNDSAEFASAFGGDPKKDAKTTPKEDKKDEQQSKGGTGKEDDAGSDDKASEDSDAQKAGDKQKAGKSEKSGEAGDAEKGVKAEDEGTEDDDSKLTAQQKLEKRAQEAAARELEPEKEDNGKSKAEGAGKKKEGKEDDEKPEEKPEEEPEEPPELPKSVKEFLGSAELAEATIGTGKDKVSLQEFAKKYPEVAEEAFHVSRAAARQATERLKAEFKKEIDQVKGELAQSMFWSSVLDKHPDAKKIVKSDAYDKWLKGQSKLVQRMETSPDPEDGVAVIDAYKESVSKASKTKKDADATKNKQDQDDTLKDNLTAKKSTGGLRESEKADEDDFSAGFYAEK